MVGHMHKSDTTYAYISATVAISKEFAETPVQPSVVRLWANYQVVKPTPQGTYTGCERFN
jgi:hypothetical protein